MTALARWIGVEFDEVSAKEKLVSAAGGFVAIAALMLITHDVLD